MHTTAIGTVANSLPENEVILLSLFGVLLEDEDDFFGVFALFVGFPGYLGMEVFGERPAAYLAVLRVHRNVHRLNLEEVIGRVQELNHVFTDRAAQTCCPVVFVGPVGCDKEDEVYLVFSQQECVTVEEPVFEMLV